MRCLIILFTLVLPLTASSFTVIAHRGLPRLFPEHSLKGLQEVLKLKVDYVEPDVVLSRDLVPVILHDLYVDKTTNAASKFSKRKRPNGRLYAGDFTLKELKTLSINNRIDYKTKKPAFKTRPLIANSQHKIPTLEEFIQTVVDFNKKNKTTIGIYLEIKHPKHHEDHKLDITKIVHNQLLKWHKKFPQQKIIIQCFDSATLKRLKREETPFDLVQLIGFNSWKESLDNFKKMRTLEGLKEISSYAIGVGPSLYHLVKDKNLTPTSFIKDAKNLGLIIHPFTLRNDSLPKFAKSEKQVLQFLIKNKVNGVFTDNSHTTLKILRSLKVK